MSQMECSAKEDACKFSVGEFDGPLVETEFWNSDALFMPQFHAARDIHDAYYVKNPTHAKWIDEPFLFSHFSISSSFCYN